MSIQARLETFKATSRRASPRRKLRLGATLGMGRQNAVIHDLSVTGVLLQTSVGLEPFDALEVDLPEIGVTQAIVVWHSGDFFGCEFTSPIPKAAISAALLRSPITRAVPNASKDIESGVEQDYDASRDLSFSTRMRVIVGTSIALWALILWAVGLI